MNSTGGSNPGSEADRMFVEAAIDTGCGTFQWRVDAPPKEFAPAKEPTPEPSPNPTLAKTLLNSRICHAAHKHYDIHSEVVNLWSGDGCQRQKTMKKGDADIYWHPIGFSDLNQNYKISWIDGCTATTEQSVETPVEGVNCAYLLNQNYYSCKSKHPRSKSKPHNTC
jgi:hypothetical protein